MGNRCCCSNSSAKASASPSDHDAKGATSSSKRSIKNPHVSDGATRLPESGGSRRSRAPEPIELSDTTMMNMNVSSDEVRHQLPDGVVTRSRRDVGALEVVNSSEVEDGRDERRSSPHIIGDSTPTTTPPLGQIRSDSLSVGVAVNSSGGGGSSGGSGTGSHLADLVVAAGCRSMSDDGTAAAGGGGGVGDESSSSRVSTHPDPSLVPAAPIWSQSTTSTVAMGISQDEAHLQCSAISFGYS